jgi:hypothetical protein
VLTLLVCWLVFPVVLAALAFGAGLLLERLSGARMATALLAPSGLALLIVVAGLTTLTSATAPLTTPLAVGLGAAGLVMGLPRVRGTVHAPAAAVAAFLAVGAPVLLSGAATFAGYIVLDDTATFLAIGDHILDEGHSLAGLAPSSYEAVLDASVGHGYPVGSMLPLAIGHQLTGQDLAWLYQPYLALLAGMLALALFVLFERLVPAPLPRAGIAALGAQPALLYGYAQWGGIKELAAAALLPLIAVHAARLEPGRRTIPAAVAVAALLGVLSVGAMVLAAVALAPALWPWRRAVSLGAITIALALPALTGAVALLDVNAPQTLTAGTELGNLVRPLRFAQVIGVWPSGDFRRDPSPLWPVVPLLLVAGATALVGVAWAVRRRVWDVLAYVASAVLGACALAAFGSPWAAGKGLAIASPALLSGSLLGCAWLYARRRGLAVGLAAAIAGGVLWSNVLAYRETSLAPRDRLAELEHIGERFSGQGPALMTEYEPYGVRHFLRRLDAEGASELRRRLVPLRDGRTLAKGAYADLDAIRPGAVLAYRTLVLRRSPAASRPPAQYVQVWSGKWYDVWQRPQSALAAGEPLSLGDAVQPGGVPACADVQRLARRGSLLTVSRAPNLVVRLGPAVRPPGWRSDGSGYVYPAGSGRLQLPLSVDRSGRYRAWVGGSVRGRVELRVDGRRVGSTARELNPAGQYLPLGASDLSAGLHVAELRVSASPFAPGVKGPSDALGPLVLEPLVAETVFAVSSSDARALCGRRFDWLAVAG